MTQQPSPTLLSDLAAAERATASAEAEVTRIRENLKTAKAVLDGAIEHERSLVRALTTELPLFDGPAGGGGAGVSTDDQASTDPTNGRDAWRSVHVSALSAVSESIVARLVAAGLETIGRLSDYVSSGDALTAIKGIGEGKATKIEDALMAFWAHHPEYCGDGATTQDATASADDQAEAPAPCADRPAVDCPADDDLPPTVPFAPAAADDPPVTIACRTCDDCTGDGDDEDIPLIPDTFTTVEDAEQAGWSEILETPDADRTHSGICPQCAV